MRMKAVLKLIIGVIIIVAIVLGLTYILNRRITEVTSQNASIQSNVYTVGSEYSGWISELNVEQGDKVDKGENILSFQSDTLKYEKTTTGEMPEDSVNQKFSEDGIITLLAPETGIVTSLKVSDNSFIPAGSTVAEVNVVGSNYVEASVLLESRDYARLHLGAPATIILPNQTRYTGSVTAINVSSNEGEANALLHIDCPELRTTSNDILTEPGTPVTVMAKLDDNGPISELMISMRLFLQSIGI